MFNHTFVCTMIAFSVKMDFDLIVKHHLTVLFAKKTYNVLEGFLAPIEILLGLFVFICKEELFFLFLFNFIQLCFCSLLITVVWQQ